MAYALIGEAVTGWKWGLADDFRQLIHDQSRCDLSPVMTTHAIGNNKQSVIGIGIPAVLIVLSDQTDVRQACK